MHSINTFIFIDLETTGIFDPKITELCMIAVGKKAFLEDDNSILPRIKDKLCICVNPATLIDNVTAKLTGIQYYKNYVCLRICAYMCVICVCTLIIISKWMCYSAYCKHA